MSVPNPCIFQEMSDEDGAETQDRSAMPGLSSAQAYCTLINFIIGVGLLNMPFAFVQAGLVVSVVMMGLVTLVGWLTTCWLLETNARALLLLRPPPSPHDGSALLPSSRPTALEITDYIGLFLGHRTRRAYELLVVFYFLGVLWAYATIYASSMATYVPLLGPTCNIYTDQGPQCHQVYDAHFLAHQYTSPPCASRALSKRRVGVERLFSGFFETAVFCGPECRIGCL